MPTTTTLTHPTVTCPGWCVDAPHDAHDDMRRPGNAGPGYDPTTQGSWCHSSSGYTVGDLEVSVSSSTDLAGNDNEPQRVWLNGVHDLTVEEARELAKALNAGCDMLATTGDE